MLNCLFDADNKGINYFHIKTKLLFFLIGLGLKVTPLHIEATYPLQLVHLDFLQIGSKKKDKGKLIYISVVTDHFTRYAKAYVTTNQTAHTVAHVFINEYVANYGWLEKILTDQAKDFEGKVFKELCDQALVKKLHMTPYHPQGNGQLEQFNRTLLTMLSTLPLDSKKKWEDWVSNLTQAYNSSPSQVTGFSTYHLMFGREPRIPLDRIFDVMYPGTGLLTAKKYNDYVFKLRERLEWAYKTTQMHIERDATHRKQYYNRKYHCMEIIPGDLVLVRQKVFGTTRKIKDQWENLVYQVVEKMGKGPVYKIQKLGEHGEKSFRELHRNMLHPLMQVVDEPGETQAMGNESTEGDSLLNAI